MATSIITTTTFTFATMIDLGTSASTTLTLAPAGTSVAEQEDLEITQCMFAAVPRCGWTARKHCGRRDACKS